MDTSKLLGTWFLSHEESTATRAFYRPATYEFPPVRAARRSMTIKPDGTALVGIRGPADASQAVPVAWNLANGVLSLSSPTFAERHELESVDTELLVLKRQP